MTEELRKLRKKRQKVYKKEGRSEEYRKLKSLFKENKRMEMKKRKEKILNQVRNSKNKNVYRILRNLGTEHEEKRQHWGLGTPETGGIRSGSEL